MNNTGTWTEQQKLQSNNPNEDILRAEAFVFGEFFLSYQKKYGGCETSLRQPILYSEDEAIGAENKAT